MSKQKFKDTLQYGWCDGSIEFLATYCIHNNPGKQLHTCPVRLTGNLQPEDLCNCCDECKNNCSWTAQIKRINRQKRIEDLQELSKLLDDD